MAAPATALPAPQAPPVSPATQWSTLQLATANLLNLARPSRSFYPNQDPYDDAEFERKTAWLGAMFERLQADVVGVQEVWDEAALRAAVARSGMQRLTVHAPGAENPPGAGGGAQGTPRVGLVTRLAVERLDSIAEFAAAEAVALPEIGMLARFERPVLRARLRTAWGQPLHVLVVHLKSKRPKYLQDAAGNALEDRDDPAVTARATMRALLQRAAEAAALRRIVVEITGRQGEHQGEPLVLLGDMNDSAHAVTTQMIAASQAAAYDRGARDVALYHALEVATEPALRRDLAYSHIHQGWPELLDQIWVSEELVAGSKFALGDIRRVEVFNDHLHESRERWRSDHGFVRALARFRRMAG
ncbi:MAG: endonuclease/exonuclease/phosphatase family protein [Rubrivivax sp.]|nr:endonuclease/exonuclease/phosphatase family protein [Rubrivivax sp.]